MSRIRGRGNMATEIAFIRLLRKNKIIGWRRHKLKFGKPDFIFERVRLALFVDGCFWHGCPRCYSEPKSNRAFWRRKVTVNRKRDLTVNRTLRKSGWQVLRIWQHELTKKNEKRLLRKIKQRLSVGKGV
ncbi:MAG: very short patch repair endonuclease [Methylacidiphilales bacterium]|nr:very short patch repair endonuclease [Candidatus Methylacidiphilales bacterium]